MPSPADLVRACLVEQELVIMPGVTQQPGEDTIICFVGSMADAPDQAICIFDTAGMIAGRRQRDPKLLHHSGIKVLVRSPDYQAGYDLANEIAVGLEQITNKTIAVEEVEHYIKTVYRIGQVIALGEEVDKKRQLWSINARVAMQDREPSLG